MGMKRDLLADNTDNADNTNDVKNVDNMNEISDPNETASTCSSNRRLDTNEKIYASLMRRDSKEKHIVVNKLIESNDALMHLVESLRLELDGKDHELTVLNGKYQLQNKEIGTLSRKIQELQVLLTEKDTIITKLAKSKQK